MPSKARKATLASLPVGEGRRRRRKQRPVKIASNFRIESLSMLGLVCSGTMECLWSVVEDSVLFPERQRDFLFAIRLKGRWLRPLQKGCSTLICPVGRSLAGTRTHGAAKPCFQQVLGPLGAPATGAFSGGAIDMLLPSAISKPRCRKEPRLAQRISEQTSLFRARGLVQEPGDSLVASSSANSMQRRRAGEKS